MTVAVSVIVPIYDAAPWLARCLDSLLRQSLKDIEILCIDDQSTDNSLEILRGYEKKDARIQVVARAENGGAAAARNSGLAAATGEYVGFVDADDYVDSDFYKKLYNAAKRENADIAKGEAFEITAEGRKRRHGPSFDEMRTNKMHFMSAWWSAIYRRDFLQRRRLDFPVGIVTGQDLVFLTKAVFLANKIAPVEGTYYNHVRRENSLSFGNLSLEKVQSYVDGHNMIMDFINEHVHEAETYNLIFGKKIIDYLLNSVLFRSGSFEGRLAVIHGAIGVWNKCKFKDEYKKEASAELVRCLEDGDEMRLLVVRLENELASERRRRLDSLSWKMTAPVRAIGRALGLPKKKNDT